MNRLRTPDWKDDDEYDHKINQDYVDQDIRRMVVDLELAAHRIKEDLDQLRDAAEAAHRYRLSEQDVRTLSAILDHYGNRAKSTIDSARNDVNHLYQRLQDHYLTVG